MQNKYKSLSESSDSAGEVSLHGSVEDPELTALNETIENCKFDSTGQSNEPITVSSRYVERHFSPAPGKTDRAVRIQ